MRNLKDKMDTDTSRRSVLRGTTGAGLVAGSAILGGSFVRTVAAQQSLVVGPNTTNRSWVLASRPEGNLRVENFRMVTAPMGDLTLGDGDVIVRNRVFQPMPSQRIRMDAETHEGYAPPFGLGEPITGPLVSEVIKTANDRFPVGSLISPFGAWEEYSRLPGRRLGQAPLPAGTDPIDVLSVFGLNAQIAYFGLLRIGEPKAGETVVVSGASGSVGSMVVQIAKLKGCKVIGIAGGPIKCEKLVQDYGVDGTIDYKNDNTTDKLRSLAPEGVDVYFDNVGGPIMQDVADQMAKFGRVVLCGAISSYDSGNPAPGPRNMLHMLFHSVKLQGFLVSDFMSESHIAIADLRKWKESGQIFHKTDVRTGFENLPETFLSLFNGKKEGTLLLQT